MNRFTLKRIAFAFNSLYTKALNRAVYFLYYKNYRLYLRKQNIPNKPAQLENEWVEKWAVLQKPSRAQYRVFAHYIGANLNIVPEDVSHNIIEPILNPVRYRFYYEDKNLYDKIFPTEYTAETLIRKMNGFYYDAGYNRIEKLTDAILLQKVSRFDKILIKPTVDSASGLGIVLFERVHDGRYIRINGTEELTVEYLQNNRGDNFILQECLRQSPFMARFNKTSVNTLRLCAYRSIKDDRCLIPSAIIRMGGGGSLVDNAHAGGVFVGINSNGRLGKYATTDSADYIPLHNGICFESEDIVIPNFEKVKEFAAKVITCVPHHRLFALDIMIDENNNPRLIEFNISGFSVWLYQFAISTVFGEHTDEIIEYCVQHKNEAGKVFMKFV